MNDGLSRVAVITGGAGGMGLATAARLGRDHRLLIGDVSAARLAEATAALTDRGISCESVQCDITDGNAVVAMFEHATAMGPVGAVVHTAGISPQMGDARAIMTVNALGTINIVNACHEIAQDGFALVNVASMAGYLLPRLLVPKRAYRIALTDTDAFMRKMLFRANLMRGDFYRSGIAYALSKNFVSWLSKTSAARFGEKGARILSVSPGSIDTSMGRLEAASGSEKMLEKAALKRFGTADELAALLSFCASAQAGYLTGVDIPCDGGVTAALA